MNWRNIVSRSKLTGLALNTYEYTSEDVVMLKQTVSMVLLLAMVELIACTAEDSVPKQPSVAESDQTEKGVLNESPNEILVETLCPETRPQICTREYLPVCGRLADGSRKTYSNGCEACADRQVVAFNADACPP